MLRDRVIGWDGGFQVQRLVSVPALGVAAMLLVGAALRALQLQVPVGYDEAYTYNRYAGDTLWHAVSKYDLPNNHLLHTAGVWLSTQLLGVSPFSLRLVAFAAGLAIPVLVYRLGLQLGGQRVALLALSLTVADTLLVGYSADGRGYSLQTLLLLVAMVLAGRFARKCVGERAWPGLVGPVLALAAVLALAVYCIPSGVYGAGIPPLWALWLVLRLRPRALPRALLALFTAGVLSIALTALLYAPAIQYQLEHEWVKVSGQKLHSFGEFLSALRPYLEGAHAPAIALLAWGAMLGGALFETAFPDRTRTLLADALEVDGPEGELQDVGIAQRAAQRVPVLVVWVLCPLALLWIHHQTMERAPFQRSFAFMTPLLSLLAARGMALGLAALPRARASVLALVVLCLLVFDAHHSRTRFDARVAKRHQDTRLMYRLAQRHLRPGDYLAGHGNLLEPVRFYAAADGRVVRVKNARFGLTVLGLDQGPGARPRVRNTLQPENKGHFYLLDSQQGERDRLRKWLRKRPRRQRNLDFTRVAEGDRDFPPRVSLWRVTATR